MQNIKTILKLKEKPISAEIKDSKLSILTYDEEGNRICISFENISYLQSISESCSSINLKDEGKIYEQTISDLVLELSNKIQDQEEGINFKLNQRHFIIPIQEEYLEIVCKTIRVNN